MQINVPAVTACSLVHCLVAKSHEKENVPRCCFFSGLKWGTLIPLARYIRWQLSPYMAWHTQATHCPSISVWIYPIRSYSCSHISQAPHIPPLLTPAARIHTVRCIAGNPLGSQSNELCILWAASECSAGHQQLLGWSPVFSKSKTDGLTSLSAHIWMS